MKKSSLEKTYNQAIEDTMHSRTKSTVTIEQLYDMFRVAGMEDISDVRELTGGEFNLAYMFNSKGLPYIVKIGPSSHANTLTYEQNIMDVELWAYNQIRENTDIKIPDIIYEGHDIINCHWFIMSVMDGTLLCDTKLTKEQLYNWNYEFGQVLAKLHTIKGERFGYMQNTLHSTWKDAYYDMVFNLIEDGERQGNPLPDTARILRFIRKWEYVLEDVITPTLIHFDLFSNNVFSDKDGHFAGLIDTERCFFGDIYTELVAINLLKPFEDNIGLIEGYNSISSEKLVITTETRARVALGALYLGLLMFTEGTTRLALHDPQHWRRKHLAVMIIDNALNQV